MTNVSVTRVRLEDMFVDEQFQRPLNERFVEKIVDNYDDKMLGVLVCNKRYDGQFSITDGHHRYEALKRMGRKQATCVVFEIDAVDEGKLFAALQKNRRPVSAIEQHKALLFSRDPLAISIDRITKQNGFTISGTSISAIQRIRFMAEHRGWKLELYGLALKTIADVWGTEDADTRRMHFVMGLWMFFERGDIRVTPTAAKDAFIDLLPRMVLRDAKIVDADNPDMGMMGAVAWVFAQQFNKYHKIKGTQKIDRRVFTTGFRTKKGNITRAKQGAINTGGDNRFEITSPFTSGEEE